MAILEALVDEPHEEPVASGTAGAPLHAPPEGAPGPAADDAEAAQSSVAAEQLKAQGNEAFARGAWREAEDLYTAALHVSPATAPGRAVYYANRAAARLKLRLHSLCADDCTSALELRPSYAKALLRRSEALRELPGASLEQVELALADAEAAAAAEPGSAAAAAAVAAARAAAERKREELKTEMIGKLKDLGNTLLGKIGLSLDNFKAEQDPVTGSYSLQFVQGGGAAAAEAPPPPEPAGEQPPPPPL